MALYIFHIYFNQETLISSLKLTRDYLLPADMQFETRRKEPPSRGCWLIWTSFVSFVEGRSTFDHANRQDNDLFLWVTRRRALVAVGALLVIQTDDQH